MNHPILESSGYKYYTLVWAVICTAHVYVLFHSGLVIELALLDGLVHSLLFGTIAPGFWYLIRFVNVDKRDWVSLVATHVVASLIAVVFWVTVSRLILTVFLVNRPEYLDFLQSTTLWRMIVGFMYYAVVVLTFYLIHYYLDLREKENNELALKALLNESELKTLKSQIDPHFIFNSLNSISALTISSPEKAREMVIKLSGFLRYSIGKDSREMNPLGEELQHAQLYLDIEKVRFGEKLKTVYEVEDTCLNVMVPNLILQPLFENAIKYGVHESIGMVTITLSCELSNGLLALTISNNYDPDSIPQTGEGIGLSNIQKRLQLVYGRNDLLQVAKKEDIFRVTLKFPLKEFENGRS